MHTDGLNEDQLRDRFDRMIGLHYVCNRWHSGQWSDLYRLMCRTELGNAPDTLSKDDSYMARHYAARYLCTVRKRYQDHSRYQNHPAKGTPCDTK